MQDALEPGVDISPFFAAGASPEGGGAPFPAGERPSPKGAVVIFPGGGYNHLAEHEGEPVARRFNAFGLSAFVVKYCHAPHRHPAPLQDARRAMRWVRFHAGRWNIRPDRIAVLGFSAGGHLAATLGTRFDMGHPQADDPVERVSCRPDAIALGYPVVSLSEHAHLGCVKNLLGEGASREQREELSAQRQIRSDTPPAFLWHTADDRSVPPWHSMAFADAMIRHHRPVELHVFPCGRHGLGLAEGDAQVGQWPALCRAWLEGLGFFNDE